MKILAEIWKAHRSLIVLCFIMLVLAVLTDGQFSSARNLSNLGRQVAINGILAAGMTLVILIGGIDLSVGSIVALAGINAAIVQVNWGVESTALTLLAAVLTGAVCGIFNGFMITHHRIPPFIITLGMMVIARGLALIFSNGASIAPMNESFSFVGQGFLGQIPSLVLCGIVLMFVLRSLWKKRKKLNASLLFGAVASALVTIGFGVVSYQYRGIPIPVLIFAVLAMAVSFVLTHTRLGRQIYAIGGNPDAAWLSGVAIKKISFGIYALMGALAGLCGGILTARLNGAAPTSGDLFELDAIAAVVIGGTSLQGGAGSVLGSVIGAFFIGTLNNGMSLKDISEFYQKVIKGAIIILAIWLDMRKKTKH